MQTTPEVAILEAKLLVPAHLVPLNALELFKKTIKGKDDEEDINFDFYDYDYNAGYYRFARGDQGLLQKCFGHIKMEDRRVSMPMSCASVGINGGYGLQFTAKLKDNQIPLVEAALANDHGQYKAPPRFGKTVVMTYLTCKRQLKTLFLSHQVDLANQALNTFYKFTNLIDLEYQLGRQIAGVVEKWEDLDKFDVAFLPYQKFVSGTDSVAKLEEYRNKFGAVYIDESHKSVTPYYSKIVGAFNSKVRQGFTGTVERKDDLHIVSQYVIGPVVAEGKANMLPCEVFKVDTGIKLPFSSRNMKIFWSKMQSFLANDSTRNAIIYSYMLAYAKAGHSIVAVTDRSAQCDFFVKRLAADGIRGEAFHSKAKELKRKDGRESLLNRMRTGESQVMIAQRSMVLGLDIPRLSAFMNLLPTANPPNYYQEYNRVRTPFDGKDVAYLVDFVDDHHILKGCYLNRKKSYRKENFLIHNDLEESPNVLRTPSS